MRVQFNHVLCATSFSDFSNRTIRYGVALAREFGARLYICHVIDLSSVAIYGEFQLDPVGQQNRIMEDAGEQLEALIGDQQVQWEALISVGNPADEIARAVEEKSIDLVITATRGRTGLKRLVLGSVTERLMRMLTCPLLVLRSPDPDLFGMTEAGIKLDKILVGCDFSPDSSVAFEHGLSLAQEFEAELHLAHVIEPPVQSDFVKQQPPPNEDLPEDYHSSLIQKLRDMVPEEAGNWCTPQTALLQGHPYEELVRYAQSNHIDMIVMGVRGHRLVKTLFLGSTTDRVIRRAPCPVLSVSSKVHKTRI